MSGILRTAAVSAFLMTALAHASARAQEAGDTTGDAEPREPAPTALAARPLDPARLQRAIDGLQLEDPEMRRLAAEFLGTRAAAHIAEVTGPLRRAARRDSEWQVQASAIRALGRLEVRAALPDFVWALRHERPEVRVVAAAALWRVPEPVAYPALARALEDSDPTVRQWAATALGSFRDPRAVDGLMETLNDDAEPAALEAVRSLRRLGAARAVPELGRLIRNDRRGTELRREAVEALTAIAGDEAASTLVPLLATRSPQVRLKVAEMLANHATGDELPALRARARRERSPAVRRALREAIARAQAADAS